jgi:hypothetical protein
MTRRDEQLNMHHSIMSSHTPQMGITLKKAIIEVVESFVTVMK